MTTYTFHHFLKDSDGNINGLRFMSEKNLETYDISIEEVKRRMGKNLSARAIVEKIIDDTFMIRDKVTGVLLKGLPANNSYRNKPISEIPSVLGEVNRYGQFVAMSEEYYMPIFTRLGTQYHPASKTYQNRDAYMRMYTMMDEILYGKDFIDVTSTIKIDSIHPVTTKEANGVKATCHTVIPINQQDKLKRTIASWLKSNQISDLKFSVWPSRNGDKQAPLCSISISITPWTTMEVMPVAKKLVVEDFYPSSISRNLVIASFTDGTSTLWNRSTCRTLSAGITNPARKSSVSYSSMAQVHNFIEHTQGFIRMLPVPENGSVEGYHIAFASPISLVRQDVYRKVCNAYDQMKFFNEVTVRPNTNGGYELPSIVLSNGYLVLNLSCAVSFNFIGADEETIVGVIDEEAKRVFTSMPFETFAENFDFVLNHYRSVMYPEGSFKDMKTPIEEKDVVVTYDKNMKRINIRVELL